MGYLVSGIIVIAGMLVVAAVRRIPCYSPLVISSLVWLLVFGVGLFNESAFFPITDQAFSMWLVWFVLTSCIYLLFARPGMPLINNQKRHLRFDYTFLLVVLILWLGYRVWMIGLSGPAHFYMNLRLSAIQMEESEPLGIIGRFYPLIFALFLFESVNASRINTLNRKLLWCWMLLYAVATMGKFAILTPVFSWVMIKSLRGGISVRQVFITGVAVVFIMLALHLIRAAEDDTVSVADMVSVYIYSPLVALGYMESVSYSHPGAYTLRFLYALNHTLFGGPAVQAVILPYVSVPHSTNVYTVLHPFASDFGFIGVILGAIVYASLFSAIFKFAQTGKTLPIIIYAGLSIVLIGQFIGDLLLTMLSGNIQFVIFAIIVVLFSKRNTEGAQTHRGMFGRSFKLRRNFIKGPIRQIRREQMFSKSLSITNLGSRKKFHRNAY